MKVKNKFKLIVILILILTLVSGTTFYLIKNKILADTSQPAVANF